MSIKSKAGFKAPSLLLAFASAAALVGCGGSEDTSYKQNAAAKVVVNTPADIAQESAENYDNNVNGLITGNTLNKWLSDWDKNRPAGITGKLVILQVSKDDAGYEFIQGDNVKTFSYLESGWTENRSNGVILTNNMVLQGTKVDALLARYAIDPRKDLVVCAQGKGGTGAAMNQGRCWFTLRYWGVDAKNIAILNGGNKWNEQYGLSYTATESPRFNKAVASVQDLGVDNTALHATLEDVINALPTREDNVLDDGVLFWDARSMAQFSAGEVTGPNYSDLSTDSVASLPASFQNGGSRQGHPRGQLHLHFQDLFSDASNGVYADKAQLAAFLDGEADARGRSLVYRDGADGTYHPVGKGNGYQKGDVIFQFCETSQRSMITAITSGVILGKPTRVYDGGMIEWNSLTSTQDKNGALIIPADSRWRTDQLSWFKLNPTPANINPRSGDLATVPKIEDPYAKDSNKLIREDKAYLREKLEPAAGTGTGGSAGGGASGGSTGGGVALPGNPCGG